MGPLKGVRVVDLTSVLMGPFATQILGDLGADVIKVEAPEGDIVRRYNPSRSAGMPGVFMNLHRNKRSIVLDLKSAAGADAFRRLVGTADVIVHNVRSQAMARLGFDYESVRALNPRIIYCIANGFRQDGPYAAKAAYDDVIQAGAGLCDIIQQVNGEASYVPAALCDKVAGMAIVYALLAALFHRERTGEGQAVEVPMFETNIAFNLVEHIAGYAFEPPMSKPGFERYMTRMRRPYQTADGYMCLLPYTDANWRAFFAFVERPDVLDDPRFSDFTRRIANIEALYGLVAELVRTRSTAEWVAFCDKASIPGMRMMSFAELWEDPHLQAVGMFGTAEHPTEGVYRTIGHPVVFSATPATLRTHAPRQGQQTDEILREIGFSQDEIEKFRAEGVTQTSTAA
ncbi:MAG: CoA transferase [Dechloromonas sp.]|nr:MAG: CoA transferase [Dechloromonas sp.]